VQVLVVDGQLGVGDCRTRKGCGDDDCLGRSWRLESLSSEAQDMEVVIKVQELTKYLEVPTSLSRDCIGRQISRQGIYDHRLLCMGTLLITITTRAYYVKKKISIVH
jgi:hypothetical protein